MPELDPMEAMDAAITLARHRRGIETIQEISDVLMKEQFPSPEARLLATVLKTNFYDCAPEHGKVGA